MGMLLSFYVPTDMRIGDGKHNNNEEKSLFKIVKFMAPGSRVRIYSPDSKNALFKNLLYPCTTLY